MPKRILIADFNHETNTFSRQPADLAAFKARQWKVGEEILTAYPDTGTELAGFLDAAKRHGWQIVPTIAAQATPSGKVTKEVFDIVLGAILEAVEKQGPIDAMLLALHGAMVCEHADDGEGALLAAIRAKVGRALPIAVTLDLHANCTDRMADLADIIVSYRTYPHVDHRETANACADLLQRMLSGEIHPSCTVARGPQLYGFDMGRTTAPGPMSKGFALAAEIARERGVHSVSINGGFAWADIAEAGPSAVIVGEGRDPRYQAFAERLMELCWQTRHERTIELISVGEAVRIAGAEGRVGAPVVIADYADNPGGGGYGDSTGLLEGMLAAGLPSAALSMLYDPAAVAQCAAAGEGARITLDIGGKIDPAFGAPLRVTGTVTRLFGGRMRREGPMLAGLEIDLGACAVLKSGGIEIVLGSKRFQNADQLFFKAAGIAPLERAVLAVKSMQHFRGAYAPIAGRILTVDEGGGCCSERFERLTFRNVRRPIFPLDPV